MKEEEKKAIELLEWTQINKLYIDTHKDCDYHDIHNAIQTVLNLIETQKAEIEKKNKMIEEMAEDIIDYEKDLKYEEPFSNKKEVIEYYTK